MPQATRVSGTSNWLWNGCRRTLPSLGEIPALWPLQGSPNDVIDNVGYVDGNDDLDDKNWDSVDDNDQDARKGVIRMSLMILVMSMTMSMTKMSTKWQLQGSQQAASRPRTTCSTQPARVSSAEWSLRVGLVDFLRRTIITLGS